MLMEGLVSPVFANAKSVESTPVTDSENVTVQCTEEALVGLESDRLIEDTVGAVLSMVKELPMPGVSWLVAPSVARERAR